MKRYLYYIIVITFIIVITVITSLPLRAATIGPVDGGFTTVSATVGKPTQLPPVPSGEEERFSIYGSTSPNAIVNIQSPIYGEAKANKNGVFDFKYLFLTLFHEDICIVAHDTEGRSTPPQCIPPPIAEANKRVGPVILPPSTSISAGSAYIGDTITLTGQTIPNAEVKLSLFTDDSKKNKPLSLVPEAYAYTIPQISLTSNGKGEYSITLPTASSQFIRMFTRALYEGNSTPKGLTLVLNIFPLWMLLFKFFATFFALLRTHLLELIILSQLYFILMYFVRRFFKPHTINAHRRRGLTIIHGEMTLLPHEITVQRESRLVIT